MARGFESKDVEYQQAENERGRASGRAMSAAERDRAAQRRSLELALAKARGDLVKAASAAHRRMLEQAIAELERQLTDHA
jgi:ribosomal protein L10